MTIDILGCVAYKTHKFPLLSVCILLIIPNDPQLQLKSIVMYARGAAGIGVLTRTKPLLHTSKLQPIHSPCTSASIVGYR